MFKKFYKILLFIFIASLCLTITGCKVESDENSTFTLKTYDIKYLQDCSIKDVSTSQPTSVSYLITPAGFDYDTLNLEGYKMQITINYDLRHKKDIILPDFTYAGAPKYELTILSSDLICYQEKDLPCSTTTQNKSYSFTFDIVNIINSKLTLTFSTNNVQNIIYFSNIRVIYNCYKQN